jgi:hypothetical protein
LIGYTLSQYLILPYDDHELPDPDPQVTFRHRVWNNAFSSQWMVVEHAFGRLKARFGYLKGIRGWEIETIHRVVESLLVLHNILIALGDLPDDIEGVEGIINGDGEACIREGAGFELSRAGSDRMDHNHRVGKLRRENLLNYWFDNQFYI